METTQRSTSIPHRQPIYPDVSRQQFHRHRQTNHISYRHRLLPSAPHPVDKENLLTQQRSHRLYGGTPQSCDRLVRPFKCPGSANASRSAEKPSRKRRKVNYADAGGGGDDEDGAYTNEARLALATRDVNRFPVFKPKDKDSAFRQRFFVPFTHKKDVSAYDAARPPPLLGMRQGATFVAKPLHDPAGEFAIVLYDPTVDDKPAPSESKNGEEEEEGKEKEAEQPKLDVPIVHKSLADILGLKKKVEGRPKVPVVIDPRLTKVLRPHQVEGVKVSLPLKSSIREY